MVGMCFINIDVFHRFEEYQQMIGEAIVNDFARIGRGWFAEGKVFHFRNASKAIKEF